MKKVILIEDAGKVIRIVEKALQEAGFEVLAARTLTEATAVFDTNPDASIIIMDACLEGNTPDTLGLVKHIRESGYTGEMIANSSAWNKELMEAGCNRRNFDDKELVHLEVIRVLSK